MPTLRRFKPGQSVTLSLRLEVNGVFTDASTLTVLVRGPDGTLLTPSIVHDDVGEYHADALLPFVPPAAPGVWAWRWQATGAAPNQNGLVEGRFEVVPLDF